MIEIKVEGRRWSAGARAAALAAARRALGDLAGERALVVLLTDDKKLQDLNFRFRGIDAPTNVLAFPALPGAVETLGDIALAFGVCRREADDQGKSMIDHLRHLVIHGVLHLLGYDHLTPAQAHAMEAAEVAMLADLGVSDPYAEYAAEDLDVRAR